MSDKNILIEKSEKYNYEVYESEDGNKKRFISPNANYVFYKDTGRMISWGKSFLDDPIKFPSPHIADIEIDECCTGLKNNGVVCKFCFPSGTGITLSNGDIKNIEDISIGDSVVSYNLDTREECINTVEEVYSRDYNGIILTIELEDGTIIRTTDNHPFYVEGKGWVEASSLIEGDDLIKHI